MVAQGQVVDEAPDRLLPGPTLLRDVPVAHRLAQDEVFGPVLSAMSFRDEGPCGRAGQRHPLRPGGRRLDPRRRAPVPWPGA